MKKWLKISGFSIGSIIYAILLYMLFNSCSDLEKSWYKFIDKVYEEKRKMESKENI